MMAAMHARMVDYFYLSQLAGNDVLLRGRSEEQCRLLEGDSLRYCQILS